MRRNRAGSRLLADIGYRLSGWPRRVLAVGCLVLAGFAVVSDRHRPTTETLLDVVVAAHALSAGTQLDSADVRLARWPRAAVPPAAENDRSHVVGFTLAGAMTTGEPFTVARLQGRGLAVGLAAGQVAVSVALADPTNARLLQAGDSVDLILRGGSSEVDAVPAAGRLLVGRVRVLAVFGASNESSGTPGSAGLVVATDAPGSLRIAGAAGSAIIATLRTPP